MNHPTKISTRLFIFMAAAFLFTPLRAALAESFITLNTFSGPATTVDVLGGGWAVNETVSIYLQNVSGIPAATAITSNDSFISTTTVAIPPATASGPLPIIAVGSINHEQRQNSFYVVPFTPTTVITGNNTPGSVLQISGTGFAFNELVVFTINGTAMGNVVADSAGNFANTSATIPNIAPGTYQLRVTGQASHAENIHYFYVGDFFPNITPSTYYLLPGQVLKFSGGGFAAGETVKVFEGKNSTVLATIVADAYGEFVNAGSVTIPLSYQGTKTFVVQGQTTHGSAQVDVTIGTFNPQITPSNYFILPGTPALFSGDGFAGNEMIQVYEGQNQTPLTHFSVDSDGHFDNTNVITVPFAWTGSNRTFTFVGVASAARASVTITIGQFNSLVTPSTYHITAGKDISFSGNGFAPHETINITEGSIDTILAHIASDTGGQFADSGLYTIPFAWANSGRTFHFTGASSHTKADVIITVAQFTPMVNPSLYYILPGSTVAFSGTGFGTNENILVTAGTSSTILTTIPADVEGNFSLGGAISIPFAWQGKHTLHFKGEKSLGAADLDLTIGSFNPLIAPSTYYAIPGQKITINGTGFAPGENVDIVLNGGEKITAQASSTGAFVTTESFVTPFKTTVLHFVATGEQSLASSTLDVGVGALYPAVTPDPWYIKSGSSIIFSGTGFAPDETINLSSAGTILKTFLANDAGGFAGQSVTTGFGPDRNAAYTFSGDKSGATTVLTITIAGLQPYLLLDTYYAGGGAPLTIGGVGFASNEPITVSFAGQVIGTPIADATGNFTLHTTVPYGAAGDKQIVVTGNNSHSTGNATFTEAAVYSSAHLGAYFGAAGASVEFVGNGYVPGEKINITTDRTGTSTAYQFTADASGNFDNSGYIIPAGFAGRPVYLTITGEHSLAAIKIQYYVTGM